MKYFLFLLFLIGALSSGVGIGFVIDWKKTISLPGGGLVARAGTNNTQNEILLSDSFVEKWNSFRNTEYGFEFEYPSVRKGQKLTVTKETPFGVRADIFYQFYLPLAPPFKKAGKIYRFDLLTLAGVDMLVSKEESALGLFAEWDGKKWVGGYDYDAKNGQWKTPSAQAGRGSLGTIGRALTWDEFLKEVEAKFKSKTIRTRDGLLAVLQEGEKQLREGVPYRFQYYVFNKDRKIAVNVVAVSTTYFTPVDETTLNATPGLYDQYVAKMAEANAILETIENTPKMSEHRKAFETEDAFLREVIRRVTLSIHFF